MWYLPCRLSEKDTPALTHREGCSANVVSTLPFGRKDTPALTHREGCSATSSLPSRHHQTKLPVKDTSRAHAGNVVSEVSSTHPLRCSAHTCHPEHQTHVSEKKAGENCNLSPNAPLGSPQQHPLHGGDAECQFSGFQQLFEALLNPGADETIGTLASTNSAPNSDPIAAGR